VLTVRFGVFLLGSVGLGLAACERPPPPEREVTRAAPIIPLDTGVVRVVTASDTFAVRVEIAEREDQRAVGLMERRRLPVDEGMIFLFAEEQPPESTFYMFRTRIPLDIAFFDEAGRILAILQMEPCEFRVAAACPSYGPGVPYRGALEMNLGYFAERGIGAGDTIELVR
jgi:uncharacterized protein